MLLRQVLWDPAASDAQLGIRLMPQAGRSYALFMDGGQWSVQ